MMQRMYSEFSKFLLILIFLGLLSACHDPSVDADVFHKDTATLPYSNGLAGKDCYDSLQKQAGTDTAALSYLAFGDSYTIGQGVNAKERWPVQLVNRLVENDFKVGQPTIIAQSGWTTGSLLSSLSRTTLDSTYDLVSLLIGVNNQYIGQGIGSFKKDMKLLLDLSVSLARNGKGVFVLSIPDYGATPFGAANAESIALEIDEFNTWIAEECFRRSIPYYDITDISRMAVDDPDLLASDQLHPSGKMYDMWVEEILNGVEDIIIRLYCN